MKERMRFVTDWERALYSMVELCERYERDGLGERSPAPHHCPHRIAADVAAAVCAGRRQHPSWGPDKILHWLKRRHPELEMPATTAAGDLLPAGDWSRNAVAGATTPTPRWCPRRRPSPMTSGPRISKVTFGPAMASIGIR